jgi:cytochrome c oxidase subunit 3
MSETMKGPPTFAVLERGVALHPPQVAAVRPERSETGVWVGMSAIVMCFAAVTSAMIVRQGASPDWRHFEIPRLLYVNTLILLGSSVTLWLARRHLELVPSVLPVNQDSANLRYSAGINWLRVTLALGGIFIGGQVLAWNVLAGQGLFLSTNPSSAFFYVFTAMHALHLLGGVGGLFYLLRKLGNTHGTAQTTGLPAVSLYWHFMDGLWIYLFVLLVVRT